MKYLIDTNVISELRRADRCDVNVTRWYASINGLDIFLSVLVLGEIRKGIELARRKEPDRANVLERWLVSLIEAFEGRILPIDITIAERWGRMSALRPLPTTDGLLAATAVANGLTLVTRNVSDFAGLEANVLNPFQPMAAKRSS